MASAYLRDELKCPICLNLYEEPTILMCGHNFCLDCIATALSTQEFHGIYSCPECREQYTERPMLLKNRNLRKIVAWFRTSYKEEILCTYCDYPVPASKTCLLCEASFCAKHLSYHRKSADHILSEPTTTYGESKCSTHKEALNYYCWEDSARICMSCWAAGEHRGHRVDLLIEASEKKKEELRKCSNALDSERQEIRRRIQNLDNYWREEDKKTFAVTRSYIDLSMEITEQLSGVEKAFLQEIRRQNNQISDSVSDLNRQLNLKQSQLARKIRHMKKLCDIRDPLAVLKMPPNGDDLSLGIGDTIINPKCLDEEMISDRLQCELGNLTQCLKDVLKTGQFSVMEKANISLDINTAHQQLIISKDLKRATNAEICMAIPDSPQRFICSQVLSVQGFTSGTHYWEVDVSEAEEWLVGVANESIERKISGNVSFLGYNEKSWSLIQTMSRLHVRHANYPIYIDCKYLVKTVGIYLEYEAGRLSFYQLCDPIRHLHTFTATFTEPLHAAFHLFPQCSIRIKT
ncbi:E3 ubiquitin-protein ligase TRIM39-like [Rana temporaria]|uniref:E3 ubiquitin-protein ligase TRIM39-like n=1 Tax=Rana temporaria TaxID=8407 RepID=UPI001AAC61B5|nr:E3 ubiquitin-protein ligase TRIM39-like [Rana temporaria]